MPFLPSPPADKVVGIVPAAGRATRLSPLPFSKELYPIGFQRNGKNGALRPKVAGQYLLERFHLAGVDTAYIVLRDGKWDIPAHFRDGHSLHMSLSYLIMRIPDGVPFSVDQAYPFVNDAVVALGFPDILFQPADAFSHLLRKQRQTRADIVLGLAPVADPENWDMVDVTADGKIGCIHVKRPRTNTPYGWFIAVWSPVFTNFLHEYLIFYQRDRHALRAGDHHLMTSPELHMGDVLQRAIEQGMATETAIFPHGACLDIGIPENLIKAVGDRQFQFN
jgi:glucose-1-phosphate thymidylyltransferase